MSLLFQLPLNALTESHVLYCGYDCCACLVQAGADARRRPRIAALLPGWVHPAFERPIQSHARLCRPRTCWVCGAQGVLEGLWPGTARVDAPPIFVNASQEAQEFE